LIRGKQGADSLLGNIAQRQMLDWRLLRGKDFNDPQVRVELERLAQRIVVILNEFSTPSQDTQREGALSGATAAPHIAVLVEL
jgi:hypothetical protein